VPENLAIQPITNQNLATILLIENEAHILPWKEQIFRDCLQAGYICWALQQDNQIIGFVIFSLKAEECEIFNICIKPSMQHQGYGYYLLQQVFTYVKKKNITMVFLEVRKSNKNAINLYYKIGCNELGIRKKYYPCPDGTREDAIMLGIDLNAYSPVCLP
jgi:[ribosomal protein S18]-alanine N-acetyltransferase